MASDSDDILVVDDQTSGPCRGAQQGGDVIALSDSDDDDVAVIPEAEHGATQDDAKCSMDCCGAVASIEEVQRAVENAAAGETLIEVCSALVCPSCGKALSIRDVRGAALCSANSTHRRIMEKLQQLTLGSLQSKGATDAVVLLLKGQAQVGASWLQDGWLLSGQSLTQIRASLRRIGLAANGDRETCIKRLLDNAAVKQALHQLAPAIGLMGVIMHLRLLVLGRLPDENNATRSASDVTDSKARRSNEGAERPLYALERVGSSKPAAGNAADGKKRSAGSKERASAQPPTKKKKHGYTENRSAATATQAAVAKGVGYGDMNPSDYLPPALPTLNPGLPGLSALANLGDLLGMGLPGMCLPGMGWGGGNNMPQMPGSSHRRTAQEQHQKQKQERVKKQRESQKEKAACIHAILHLLKASCTNPVMGPMPAPVAVMLHGGLSSVLHDLLEDSIDALLDDAAVQRPLLTLLEALSAHLPLLPVLTAKGSWPDHLLPEGDRAAEESAAHSGTSIADRLSSMRAGCDLWQREGQQMLNDEDEAGPSNQAGCRDSANDIALVLHASNVGDTVQGAVEAAAHYKEEAAEPGPPAATSSNRKCTRQDKKRAEAGAASAEQAKAVAMREEHAAAMHKHALFQANLEQNHAYRTEASANSKHQSEIHAKRNKVIMKQLTSLSSSLPAHFESSVHVAVSTERTDMARVLILAGPDTPYAYGAFVFDVFFPFNFPTVPPKMKFLTTGGGTVRFNPNLYNCGKVCLSLLGTWSGPSWSPAHSTFLQVLVSLQAMVFCEHPFFNEPGYERMAGSSQGESNSNQYNTTIRHNTAKHAIYACLTNPDGHPHGVFKDVLDLHWRAKGTLLKEYLKEHKVPLAKEISKKLDTLLQKSSLVNLCMGVNLNKRKLVNLV